MIDEFFIFMISMFVVVLFVVLFTPIVIAAIIDFIGAKTEYYKSITKNKQ